MLFGPPFQGFVVGDESSGTVTTGQRTPPLLLAPNDNANLRSRSFLRRDWWFRGVAAGWEPTKQRRRGGFAPKRLRRESKRGFRKDKD